MTGWTQQSTVSNVTFNSVTYGLVNNNGLYVAVGSTDISHSVSTIMTSSDGIKWISQASPIINGYTNKWTSVAYGEVNYNGVSTGLFVAVSDSGDQTYRIMTSPDGKNWTLRSVSYGYQQFVGIAYGIITLNGSTTGAFIALEKNGWLFRSTDGVTWNRTNQIASRNYCIAYSRELGSTSGNFIVVTSSLQSYRNRVFNVKNGDYANQLTYIPANTWRSICCKGNQYIIVGDAIDAGYGNPRSAILNSKDYGSSWRQIFTKDSDSYYSVTCDQVTNYDTPTTLYVAVGDQGLVSSSTDGTNWQTINPELTNYSGFGSVTWGGQKFVTVVQTNPFQNCRAYTSDNGDVWTARKTPFINIKLSDVAYGGGTYVAISDDMTGSDNIRLTNVVLTSSDGLSWEQIENVTGAGWTSIASGRVWIAGSLVQKFVAVAYNEDPTLPLIMTSLDGKTWSYPYPSATRRGRFINIAYVGNIFVAISDTPLSDNPNSLLLTSTDGIDWSIQLAANNIQWNSIAYGNGVYVCVGGASRRVMTSPDAITWTLLPNNINISNILYNWTSIVFGNGIFVASAANNNGRIMTSSDGIHWNSYDPNCVVSNSVFRISYGAGMFMGLTDSNSDYSAVYSFNGMDWQAMYVGLTANWSAITYGNNKFVGVAHQEYNQIVTYAYGEPSTLSSFTIPSQQYAVDKVVNIPRPESNSTGAFTYISSNTGVCIVDGENLIVKGVGSATITATQAASIEYVGGATISTIFTVTKGDPNLRNFAYTTQTKDSTIPISPPQTDSDGIITYSLISGGDIATIYTNNSIVFTGVGTVTVRATQNSTSLYREVYIDATFRVKLPTRLSNFSIPSAKLSSGPVLIVAPSKDTDSGIDYVSSDPSVASISGDTLSLHSIGTVTITARVTETNLYVGGGVTTSFTVLPDLIDTQLSISPISNKTYGDVFDITATTTNENAPITYSTSTPSLVSISGNKATMVGVGSAIITASQAQTSTHTSASSEARFSIDKATTILHDFYIESQTVNDVFTISPPRTNSDGPFIYTTTTPTYVSIHDNQATILNAGLATITATQSGTNNYTSSAITTSFITRYDTVMSNFSIPNQIYNNVFTIPTPTTTSSAPIRYVTMTPSIVSISGTTATMTGTGIAVILAVQDETTQYNSGSINATFQVAKANPSYGVFTLTIPENVSQNQVFTINPPSSTSQGTYRYTLLRPNISGLAIILGNKLKITASPGIYEPPFMIEILATQNSTSNYNTGSITSNSVYISQVSNPTGSVTPTLTGFTIDAKTVGDDSFTIIPPTSNSGGNFTYSVTDGTLATVSGDIVTVRAAGTTTIIATQAATDMYGSASVNAELVIYPSLTSLSSPSVKIIRNSTDKPIKITRRPVLRD
jgi:hypothetical protein